MWSGKPAKAKQYVDASETLQKAKMQVSTLQRQKKIPAIVDFVKAGSRFTVLIPRENVKLNFVLGGIRAPKSARNPSEKGEPFGQEAHDFATRRLTQRDVEIDVHNIDKVGGFIGELYINKESFAKILVEEGLATVHTYSAEQSGNATELLAAEQRAKSAKKGLWVDWDPSLDALEEAETPNGANGDSVPAKRENDYRDVIVTHVDETCRLKLQIIGTGTSALELLMSQFKAFHLKPSNNTPLPGPPKTGDYVVGLAFLPFAHQFNYLAIFRQAITKSGKYRRPNSLKTASGIVHAYVQMTVQLRKRKLCMWTTAIARKFPGLDSAHSHKQNFHLRSSSLKLSMLCFPSSNFLQTKTILKMRLLTSRKLQ